MSKETGTRPQIKMLSLLKEKLDFTYIAIIVLSVALYVGFDDLISGAASGTARDTISAALAAIFVLITTMYMLNKQTDVEHKKKLDTEIFKRKFIIYDQFISILQNIGYYKNSINDDDYRKCLNKYFELVLVAPVLIVEKSNAILKLLKSIRKDGEFEALDEAKQQELNLDEVKQQELRDLINEFCVLARADFNLTKADTFDPAKFMNITDQLTEPESKNHDKFEFNKKLYKKNRLVLEVVRYTVDDRKVKNIKELKELFPNSYWSEGKDSNARNAFIVELKKDAEEKKARFFKNEKDIIKFDDSDSEVIVNNQWGTNINYFVDKMSTDLNYKIKRDVPNQ